MLAGTFPDSNALNYLLTAVDAGGTVVPFDVLSVTPTSMTAVVGPAPAGMGSGTLGIALGAGNEVPIDALGAEFNLAGPIWVWSANEEGVVSSVDFEFQGAPSPSTYFGFLESGGPNLQVSSPCAEGATLDTWLVAQQGGPGSTEPFYAVALHIPAATLLRFQGPMTCANNLGDLIGDVLLAHAPDSISSQYSTQEGDPGFILGFSIDNLNADSGAFVVRVEGE